MAQITSRVSDELLEALDAVSMRLNRSRASVIREALERFLEDVDDISIALERQHDPSDPILDWDEVKRELLGTD